MLKKAIEWPERQSVRPVRLICASWRCRPLRDSGGCRDRRGLQRLGKAPLKRCELVAQCLKDGAVFGHEFLRIVSDMFFYCS